MFHNNRGVRNNADSSGSWDHRVMNPLRINCTRSATPSLSVAADEQTKLQVQALTNKKLPQEKQIPHFKIKCKNVKRFPYVDDHKRGRFFKGLVFPTDSPQAALFSCGVFVSRNISSVKRHNYI